MENDLLFGKRSALSQEHRRPHFFSRVARKPRPSQAVDPAYYKKRGERDTSVACSCGCGIMLKPTHSDAYETINGLAHYACVVAKVVKLLEATKLRKLKRFENWRDIRNHLRAQAEFLMNRPLNRWVTWKLKIVNEACEFMKIEPIRLSKLAQAKPRTEQMGFKEMKISPANVVGFRRPGKDHYEFHGLI